MKILVNNKKIIIKKKKLNKIKNAFISYKGKKEKSEEKIIILNPLDQWFLNKALSKPKNPPKKNIKPLNLKIYNNNRYIDNYLITLSNPQKDNSSKLRILNKKNNQQEIIKKIEEIMEYNDEEKNNLKYELALRYDKRTYFEYYLSLLKTKHLLIFSFCYNKDYNSKIIKIDLFFINFISNYFINALFFNDNTMHKIYEDEGSFNIVYQLPQIIYSSLISNILDIILKLLSLTENDILSYKENKNQKNIENRKNALISKLKIKLILYFIISFIFLLFFSYYLSIFCAIYRNTQYHLIKDTLISFGLSLIYPFGIYLLPGIFRIPALSNPKNKNIYLFNLCLLLQYL